MCVKTETNLDYKKAYEREKLIRERAEKLLEDKSRALYASGQELAEQYNEVKTRSLETELLYAVASMTDERLGIQESLFYFAKSVCDVFHMKVCSIFIPSKDDATKLEVLKIYSPETSDEIAQFEECTQQKTFEIGSGIPGKIYQENDIRVFYELQNIDKVDGCKRFELIQAMGIDSAFGFPFHCYNKTVGVVEFFYNSDNGFEEKSLEVILTASHQLGALIERRKAEKEIKQSLQKTKIMNQKLIEAQAQLVQSEKMASLGQLSAGVAHEINNPIAFVISNVSTLNDYISSLKVLFEKYEALMSSVKKLPDENLQEIINEIEAAHEEEDIDYILDDIGDIITETNDGTKRVKDIVEGLKSFSRIDQGELVEADINEGIKQTIKIAWNEIKYHCEVVENLKPLPKIRCLAGQLNQVFMNLIVNGGHAIQEKGVITIETDVVDSYISIKISDNGKGIEPEHIEQLFNPFFTTKAVGKGTGLGLSISYGIIKKHKGTITVDSEVGVGTTFHIKLPIEGITEEDLANSKGKK